MTRIIAIGLAATLAVVGCAAGSSFFPPAKKGALREFLDPSFVATSITKDREGDFYAILEVFSTGRAAFLNERVRNLEFLSSSEARLSFSDSGMHGGGVAMFKKVGGRWTIEQKLHFL